MNLRDIKPSLNLKKSSLPSTSIGAAGDKAGDFVVDGTYMYYCYRDYVDSNLTFSITVDNQTSSSTLRKESGVTDDDFVEWTAMLNPTAGSWVFSFPTVSQATIQNIPVQGITLNRANGNYSDRRISISFDSNLVNNLPGFNSNYNLLWDKPCVLTGRASIWRKIELNTRWPGQT
jgi:hypothetical protein